MMSKRAAAKLLVSAAKRDYADHPEIIAEAGKNGQIRNLIIADVSAALRDIPVPSVFPNLRSAVTQIAGSGGLSGMGEDEAVGTNDTWAAQNVSSPFSFSYNDGPSSGGVPGMTTTFTSAPAAAQKPATSGGDDWTKMFSSIIKSAADAGSAIYTAKIKNDAAVKQTSLLSKAASLLTGGTSATGLQTSSMMSGGMIPLLLGLGAVGAIAYAVIKTKGGGRRVRRRR